jgi:outer membrane lipoprotein SlyB
VGGAVIGHQIEKGNSRMGGFDVRVRLDDGSLQSVRVDRQPDFRPGDKVRIENGRLVRDR